MHTTSFLAVMLSCKFSKVSEGLSEIITSCPPNRAKSPLQSPLWIFFSCLKHLEFEETRWVLHRCLKLNMYFVLELLELPLLNVVGTTACPMILTFPEHAGEAGKMRQVWEGE